jgi:CRISPR-associated protein Cas1
MNTIYITDTECKIHRDGNHILVKKHGYKVGAYPIEGAGTVIVQNDSIQFTTQALALFMEKKVDVVFASRAGKIKGQLLSQLGGGVVTRLAQYHLFTDKAKRLRFAKQIVRGKISGQLHVVEQYRHYGRNEVFASTAHDLSGYLMALDSADSIDAVMGFEGISAKSYFKAIRERLVRGDFARREYRPAHDIVNSAFNLGYAFLANESMLALHALRLDTELGFLHSIHYGRNSLALDLMEEFRAPFIDRFVVNMFNAKRLTDEMFADETGGYYLTDMGYRAFCAYYHEYEERGKWHSAIRMQAKAMRRAILDGTDYMSYAISDDAANLL